MFLTNPAQTPTVASIAIPRQRPTYDRMRNHDPIAVDELEEAARHQEIWRQATLRYWGEERLKEALGDDFIFLRLKVRPTVGWVLFFSVFFFKFRRDYEPSLRQAAA